MQCQRSQKTRTQQQQEVHQARTHTHTRTHWHAVRELCKVVLVNLMNFRHLSSTDLSRAGGLSRELSREGEKGELLSLCPASNEVLRHDFAHD